MKLMPLALTSTMISFSLGAGSSTSTIPTWSRLSWSWITTARMSTPFCYLWLINNKFDLRQDGSAIHRLRIMRLIPVRSQHPYKRPADGGPFVWECAAPCYCVAAAFLMRRFIRRASSGSLASGVDNR